VVFADVCYQGSDKRQFGHAKVRYRGLTNNTAQLVTLFALSNLWMVRKQIFQVLYT
jgi:transposase, IS5 family